MTVLELRLGLWFLMSLQKQLELVGAVDAGFCAQLAPFLVTDWWDIIDGGTGW